MRVMVLVMWEEKRRYKREMMALTIGKSTDAYLHDSFPPKFSRFRASS